MEISNFIDDLPRFVDGMLMAVWFLLGYWWGKRRGITEDTDEFRT